MPMTVKELTYMVSRHYNVGPGDLFKGSRNRRLVEARRVCWALLRRHTHHSYPAIARIFKTTHDNILRGSNKLEKALLSDTALAADFEGLETKYLKAGPVIYPEWDEQEAQRARKWWFNPNLTIGLAAQYAQIPRHIFAQRCRALFGERVSISHNPRDLSRMPKQLSDWPDDMRFEDHPDCNDKNKDLGLRGRQPKLRHTPRWQSSLVGG